VPRNGVENFGFDEKIGHKIRGRRGNKGEKITRLSKERRKQSVKVYVKRKQSVFYSILFN
jgi:hypothetical protein